MEKNELYFGFIVSKKIKLVLKRGVGILKHQKSENDLKRPIKFQEEVRTFLQKRMM